MPNTPAQQSAIATIDGQVLPVSGTGITSISPTDISQFLRREQCQRYLHLRLYEREHGDGFMYDYGVAPQRIPPLLTRSGAEFERRVEAAIGVALPVRSFADEHARPNAGHDNEPVRTALQTLGVGQVLVLFQPRLEVDLGNWRVRGDVDILRAERDGGGALHVLIADMKSSAEARVEHRLQVAFYAEMLETLLGAAGIPCADIDISVLYRGPADLPAADAAQRAALEEQRGASKRLLGVADVLLEVVADQQSYRDSVRDLVTGPHSVAERVAQAPFAELPFHLSYKCDGCLYNEFCLKQAAEADDLSLLPHLTTEQKGALRRAGLRTTRELAALKDLPPQEPGASSELTVTPGKEALVARLGATWPVGPRLDELIHRARRYRSFKGDRLPALSYIPSKGYGSLPYCAPDHNPNLVRVYIDAQHDYLQDRIYLLGALVVASEHGVASPARRRSVVELTDGPPDTLAAERELFLRFARAVVRAVVELAAPDETGEHKAPIHLIFWNRFEQRLLLDGLARHLDGILEATPLYDFVTQPAAFDSSVLTYLDEEIRELKSYPMLCQSLQAVASYLKFDWKTPAPFSDIFHARLFDYWRKFDDDPGERQENRWYTGRSRFNSQIPLEYVYAAWGELPLPAPGEADEYSSYRRATRELLHAFQVRRLEAMEHVASDFRGNQQTAKSSFALPDLARFDGMAGTLAEALDEFLTIERHVELAEWKAARLLPPERRVLAGDTLLVEYREEDQDPEVAAFQREGLRRQALYEQYRRAAPDGKLTKEQQQETKWSPEGQRLRLRLSCQGVDCSLDDALLLSDLREGERVVIMPRLTTDTRPSAPDTPFTPTPKQILYAPRVDIGAITVQRDADGAARSAMVELALLGFVSAGKGDTHGLVFPAGPKALQHGGTYTLDADPNDFYGLFCLRVVEGLRNGGRNVLYERLLGGGTPADWPAEAEAGQRRFLQGLEALHAAGALHAFEPSKQEYIGGRGRAPLLLVQGPPGTGKSYATAFAVFARLQGALAAGREFRAFLCCKTHAATDVLTRNAAEVQVKLRELQREQPAIFARYFNARLLDVPLYRLDRPAPAEGITSLPRKGAGPKGQPRMDQALAEQPYCLAGTTPGGVYRLLMDRGKGLFGYELCDCLVLDEASQMNLPEALMAALTLRAGAPVIVVGDHRQMPPIVKHDWAGEPRRTFRRFRSYESLFLALQALDPPVIKFAESFRLHTDTAEFLRREIYTQDGIAYFSRRHQTLLAHTHADPFLDSVLRPEQTIVVVLHDEEGSMLRNPFEEQVITEILAALAAPPYALDAEHGLGVVVPHRAQRAALQQNVPYLNLVDPLTGRMLRSAVDTVERFQGDERATIIIGATESDPQYLLLSSEFLLDPRRLTVALSRAKNKLILVAARSVFTLFATEEETFEHAQLWKNLLRRTCTRPLWSGVRDGQHVEVWGNARPVSG